MINWSKSSRLAVAFAAAAGMHVLIFQFSFQSDALQLHSDERNPLQLELVKKARQKHQQVAKTPSLPVQQKALKAVAPQPQRNTLAKALAVKPARPHIIKEPRLIKPGPPTDQAPVQLVAPTTPALELAVQAESVAGAIPADVERMIMTRINYPRKARRKGWQGRAMFHLDVREQKLASLDIHLSSGHSMLDRAAIRGIRSIAHLPLANGLYNLPVEFRLQ